MRQVLFLLYLIAASTAFANPCDELRQKLENGIALDLEVEAIDAETATSEKEVIGGKYRFELSECQSVVGQGLVKAAGIVSPYFTFEINGKFYNGFVKENLDVSYVPQANGALASVLDEVIFECLELRVHGATIAKFLHDYKSFQTFKPSVPYNIMMPFLKGIKKKPGEPGIISYFPNIGEANKNGKKYMIRVNPVSVNGYYTLPQFIL